MSKKISDYYFLSLFSLINILLIDISFILILIKSQNFLFLKKKTSNINLNNLCIFNF